MSNSKAIELNGLFFKYKKWNIAITMTYEEFLNMQHMIEIRKEKRRLHAEAKRIDKVKAQRQRDLETEFNKEQANLNQVYSKNEQFKALLDERTALVGKMLPSDVARAAQLDEEMRQQRILLFPDFKEEVEKIEAKLKIYSEQLDRGFSEQMVDQSINYEDIENGLKLNRIANLTEQASFLWFISKEFNEQKAIADETSVGQLKEFQESKPVNTEYLDWLQGLGLANDVKILDALGQGKHLTSISKEDYEKINEVIDLGKESEATPSKGSSTKKSTKSNKLNSKASSIKE